MVITEGCFLHAYQETLNTKRFTLLLFKSVNEISGIVFFLTHFIIVLHSVIHLTYDLGFKDRNQARNQFYLGVSKELIENAEKQEEFANE